MKITLPIGKSTINDHFTPFYIAAFVYQIPQFEHLNFKHSQSPLLVLFCHLYFLYFWISQRSPKEFIAKSPNEQCSKPSVVPLYIFILLGSLHGLNCDHLCIGRFITPQYHQPTVPKASTARPLDCTFHLVYGGLKLPDLFVQAQNVLARGAPGAPGTLMKIRECTNNTPMELKVVQITYPSKKWMQLEIQYDLFSSILWSILCPSFPFHSQLSESHELPLEITASFAFASPRNLRIPDWNSSTFISSENWRVSKSGSAEIWMSGFKTLEEMAKQTQPYLSWKMVMISPSISPTEFWYVYNVYVYIIYIYMYTQI